MRFSDRAAGLWRALRPSCTSPWRLRPCPRRCQKQQNRGRVEEQRNDQDEVPQNVLVTGTEQGGEVADRPQGGFGLAALPLDAGLVDLKASKALSFSSALVDKTSPGLALLVGERHRRACPALGRSLLDRAVYLGEAPIDVRHDAGLHRYPGIDIGDTARNRRLAFDLVADVRLGSRRRRWH